MKAVFSVSASDDFLDTPSFFVIEITQEVVALIERLQEKLDDDVVSVVADAPFCVWEDEEVEDELSLFGDEMIVGRTGCLQFKTYAKHSNGCIETSVETIKQVVADFEEGKALVFYSGDVDTLKELWQENQEPEVA